MPTANTSNPTILITGAGSGIGRATARMLLAEGWNVVLLGRTEATLLQTAQDHERALVLTADVANADQVSAAFAQATEHFGRLDVLFNNAGTFGPAVAIDELTAQDWDLVCQVNLTGAMNCAREAFKFMKTHGGGRIINNGSISAQVPRPRSVAYAVTKHAITGLTKSIELDGRPFSICASQIDIGNTATDIMEELGASHGALQADGSRKVEPTFALEQAANAVVFLATSPLTVSVNQLTITAAGMPFIGRG